MGYLYQYLFATLLLFSLYPAAILPEDVPIVKGYVAFGDSYAAGIGAGAAQGRACRRGSLSYPNQLAADFRGNTNFQNLPCSDATVSDVVQGGDRSQTDAWINPSSANFAALTIGGNDIAFNDILQLAVQGALG